VREAVFEWSYLLTSAARQIAFAFFVPRRRKISSLAVLPLLALFLLVAPHASAQGFGGSKKKIQLHRVLPAAVQLTGTSFDIKASAHDPKQADVAQSLSDLLETELLKDNHNLKADTTSPDYLVICTVTEFETPPPQSFSRDEVALKKSSNGTESVKYNKYTGNLAVTYQLKDTRIRRAIDSDTIVAKYSKEFEADTNAAADNGVGGKVLSPFKHLAGSNKDEETETPPTTTELRQILLKDAVHQIAERLANTDEVVEVLLARGKLDKADKYAESELWSRNLETLEQMDPFSKKEDDAYRLYNIGVANEALAYKAEDHATARKFLEEAAISYGKAIDANPDEKYFLQPQKRIETASDYYRKLDEQKNAKVVADDPPPAPVKADDPAPAVAPAGAKKTGAKTPATKTAPLALTNDKIIEMFKKGVDEANIVATIKEAPAVKFDLTPDGQIALADAGVKGNIVMAMRERAKRPNR
jgi:tetratricopeptide (TPR) repeat protein